MLRRVRIVLAGIMFTVMTLLFLDFTGVLRAYLSWVAKIQFLPALLSANVVVVLVLLLAALLFGRIYCSIVCPLGVMQDLFSSTRMKKNRFHYSKEKRWLRYGMFILFAVLLVLGVSAFVVLLDPYSAYGRIASTILQPIYIWCNNLCASIAERVDSYAFYSVDIWVKSAVSLSVALITLLVVGFLAWRGGRTYCNNICPVGTLLSFFARFSLLKIRIDEDKCVSCGVCSRNCKGACINIESHEIDYSRCVVCGNCIAHCHSAALAYGLPKKKSKTEEKKEEEAEGKSEEVDLSRRAFLIGAGLAATGALLAQDEMKVDGGLAEIEEKVAPKRKTPILPPGALSARNMQKHCTACQLCIAACPNGVLRPTTDLNNFMQPTASYERGYCRVDCVACSEVCPTGAIRPITLEEKSAIQVGHAVWIEQNCVVITDSQRCRACSVHCPTGAITLVALDEGDEHSLKVPAIDVQKCIGCGACENLCPARPLSAIYVEGHEVHKEI